MALESVAEPNVPMALDFDAMPSTFKFAESISLAAQGLTRVTTGWELISLVIAASAGILSWRIGTQRLDIFAGVGSIAFVSALLAMYWRRLKRPDDAWYAARAAAESIKTLTWRYCVQGDPFPRELNESDVRSLLLD